MTECAICGSRDCVDSSTKHLLACFDLTFDGEGLHDAGLVGGALYPVKEIGRLLDAIQFARVQAWTPAGPSATGPVWIADRRCLRDYFAALGDDGFDPKDYDSPEDAVTCPLRSGPPVK